MRKRRRRTSGVSLGTILTLTLLGLVISGCVLLLPKLMGSINDRVDAQRVSVAIDASLRSLHGDTATPAGLSPNATPATAPPLEIAAYATPTPTAPPESTRRFSLTAAGSISIDTDIQQACTGAEGYAFEPVFAQLTGLLKGDLNVATLENLTVINEKLTDVNMPGDALAALRAAKFNVLCTGFPGVLSLGISGLGETLNAISTSGMTPYGTYLSQDARNHVVALQTKNIMVALLSFQGELSSASKKQTSTEEQAYAIAPLTLPAITAEITAARAAGAQIVVVSLCWGKVGATVPTGTQRELAQGIANAGADIILGTHSGAVQTVELLSATRADGSVHNTVCAYSLGYLLNSDRSNRDNVSGMLLHIDMTYDLALDTLAFDSLTYTPTYIWREKIDDATVYSVVPSNAAPPEAMGSGQQDVMARSLSLVRERLAGSAATEAKP
ncbi:MAG: CapA family protein [Eubacteriales bacterium]|nr:CapA family protein [Eubacteriales bacterium]